MILQLEPGFSSEKLKVSPTAFFQYIYQLKLHPAYITEFHVE